MKLKIILFSALITLSTATSADWWDGWNDTSSSANVQGNSKGNAYGNTQGSGTGSGKANGWGTGRGDADGSINFSLNFKGKGRTNMDTKMAGDGATNASGDALGNALTNGYLSGYGAGSNNQNGYGSRFPFGNNNNFMGNYNRMPMGYGAPNFNVPMYRQSPYLYRPLPLQIPGMQMPYANQGYGGYPTPMNQQNIQTDDRLKKMQEKMNAQEKQYNAFVAKMKAQQKEMMEEFTKQRGVTAK